jgi:hypothetical protein
MASSKVVENVTAKDLPEVSIFGSKLIIALQIFFFVIYL